MKAGAEFLQAARDLVQVAGAAESHWRSAISRAYYALFLEAREQLRAWGIDLPPNKVHVFVSQCFYLATQNKDSLRVARDLDKLRKGREKADYELACSPIDVSRAEANKAIILARESIDLLKGIRDDHGPTGRDVVIESIKKGSAAIRR